MQSLRLRCAATVALGLAVGACGGGHRPAPTHRDIAVVTGAVADIVYQCQSVSAGYISAPDEPALRHDADRLLAVYARVRPDARFVVRSRSIRITTTMRRQVSLAARTLRQPGCSAAQAGRLKAALDS